jgi:glutamine amidotransferase
MWVEGLLLSHIRIVNSLGIIDYGMGNIRSVVNAFEELGAKCTIVNRPENLNDFNKLVLPGVGAFGDAMANLRKHGMDTALMEVAGIIPILGICLGMQLMCKSSLEGGINQGLGWIDADVVPLPHSQGLKIPHMGWNDLIVKQDKPLLSGLTNGSDLYFVHSFQVVCHDPADIVATCCYGVEFTAAFSRGLFHGTQFHPEKSQRAGLRILENFLGV